jgi:O-antigen/teichoic acid export membrane protein
MTMGIVAAVAAMTVAAFSGYAIAGVGAWAIYVLISTRAGLLRYTLETPLRMRVRFGLVSTLGILDGLLFLIAIYVMRHQLTVATIIGSFIASTLPSFFVLVWLDRGRHLLPSRASWQTLKELLREATPVMISVVLLNVHDKIDAFMLEWFSTPTEVGVFSAAYQSLAPFVSTLPIAAVMAIVPVVARLATEDEARSRTYALTGLRVLTAGGIGVAITASMLTPTIIELVSKGRYADNELQFFAFLWMTFPIFMLFYIQELNIALGAQRSNIRITATLAIGTVVAGLLLIPLYDSLGAIAAKIIAILFAASIAVRQFHRFLHQSLTLSRIVGIVGSAAICLAAAWLLPQVMPRPLALLCGVAIWAVVVVASGLIRRSDVLHLTAVFAGKRT